MQVKFEIRKLYKHIKDETLKVEWRFLMKKTMARPRALFVLWLDCHNRLAIKERLKRFGMLADEKCSFSDQVETANHIFFACTQLSSI